MNFICPYTCSYRTNSGFCGRTGDAENCQKRRFLGYDSETRQFIVEPVAAGNIIVKSLQTNADRIRSMSDEELAEWLWFKTGQCPPFDRCPQPDRETPCVMKECWLDWLKQEGE